jgi:phosphatidylserine/phosphatidylglycerophosphate/cardiolipin synthase-like enzyme
VSIIVEPSDHGDAIVAAIKGATKSVHMTMYLLSDTQTEQALIDRHKAGVDVRVLLNQTFPPNSGQSNASAYSTLQAAKVQVEWAPAGFVYTHEKCVVLDGATAWIMTMNLTFSSPDKNREYLAIDTDPADVAEVEAVFEADWAQQSITPNGKLLVAPSNTRQRLLALVALASATIDLEGEELSDAAIVSALAAKADAGVAVRVILTTSSSSSAQANAVTKLTQHGVHVVGLATPYVHGKAIVVDAAYAYVGSANFTQNSLDHNREVGIITAKASEVAKVAATLAQDFSSGSPM